MMVSAADDEDLPYMMSSSESSLSPSSLSGGERKVSPMGAIHDEEMFVVEVCRILDSQKVSRTSELRDVLEDFCPLAIAQRLTSARVCQDNSILGCLKRLFLF